MHLLTVHHHVENDEALEVLLILICVLGGHCELASPAGRSCCRGSGPGGPVHLRGHYGRVLSELFAEPIVVNKLDAFMGQEVALKYRA
jgi:hypothetical protein